jgi:hypothetical protein
MLKVDCITENPIGKFVVIAYKGKSYVGNVLDCDSDFKPKRVRIQNDTELQGKVVMPSEYTIKEFADVWD